MSDAAEEIDEAVGDNIEVEKTEPSKLMQLATDATRLLSFTGESLSKIKESGFFERIRDLIPSRKSVPAAERAPEVTLAEFNEMKAYAEKSLEALNQRNLLTADALITVKNNLNTLAVSEKETRDVVTNMITKIADRFEKLESRIDDLAESIDKLDDSVNLVTWVQGVGYDSSYKDIPESIRFLRIVKEFYNRKHANYTIDELRLLKKALKDVGIDYSKKVTLGDFTDSILEDLQNFDENKYLEITKVEIKGNKKLTAQDVSEIIAVPSFVVLCKLPDKKNETEKTVNNFQSKGMLNGDPLKAVQEDVKNTLKEDNGIDMDKTTTLSDLAIELVSCYSAVPHLIPKKCKYCGAYIRSNGKFCLECGKPILEEKII